MPLIDGFIDFPALDWCPPYDAALWIMRTRPPVASRHLTSLGDDVIRNGIDANGLNVMLDRNYYPSWSKLYEVASQGKIGLRGKPAIGLYKIEFRPVPPLDPWLRYEKRGELEEIPAEKIKAAGVGAFFNIAMQGFLNDGVLCPTEFVPETAWAYTDLEVNVRQLVRWFHPAEGKNLRFGDEVIFLEPEAPPAETSAETPRAETSAEAPQAKSSAKAAGTRNVGGRPRIWDRDGAINATSGAIYDRKLVRTPEAAAILGLSASTLEKLRLSGNGPKYAKLGRVCAYSLQDLEAWAAARSRNSTSEPSGES
jgi:predicted DNA-binding transcriptional regulator AlpA